MGQKRECGGCRRIYKPSSRHKLCPRCREIKQRKPCVDCRKEIWGNSTRCIVCLGKQQSDENSPNWKGGKAYNHRGYVYKKTKEHPRGKKYGGRVFEHILVMEEKIGRLLTEGENVHHVNGVRDDNRPENLELWTRPQPAGIRVKDAIKWAREIIDLYGEDESKY